MEVFKRTHKCYFVSRSFSCSIVFVRICQVTSDWYSTTLKESSNHVKGPANRADFKYNIYTTSGSVKAALEWWYCRTYHRPGVRVHTNVYWYEGSVMRYDRVCVGISCIRHPKVTFLKNTFGFRFRLIRREGLPQILLWFHEAWTLNCFELKLGFDK